MNIALFASSFHPHIGGVEEHVRQFTAQVNRRVVRPIVITNRWPRTLPEVEDVDGITVYRLALRTPTSGMKSRMSYFASRKNIERKIREVLLRHDVDLLHIHCAGPNTLYASAAKEATGLPMILTTHGERVMYMGRPYLGHPFLDGMLRRAIRLADAITACSQYVLDDLANFSCDCILPKASVITNGIDFDEFERFGAFPHRRPFILALGRLIPKKGFDILLQAYSRYVGTSGLDCQPDHDLVIAGDGGERLALERLANELGIGDRVTFCGPTDRQRTVGLFKACSFFVLPSRIEPQGIVNLEAMAAGKAVVASDVGGVPEIVLDGETGRLVPPDDPAALSQAIAMLAVNGELRERMGRSGRSRAKNFDWSGVANQYVDLYRHVLDDNAVTQESSA